MTWLSWVSAQCHCGAERNPSCNHEDSRSERDSGEKRWVTLFHPKGSEVRAGAACSLVSSTGPGTLVLGICGLGAHGTWEKI